VLCLSAVEYFGEFNMANPIPLGNTVGLLSVAEYFNSTHCCICGGTEDEDLIILCDGPNCPRETHMYCLRPPLFEVPKGKWYCDVCDVDGSTKFLRTYFENHDKTLEQIGPKSKADYDFYFQCLQESIVNLENWQIENICEWKHPRHPSIPCEFQESAIKLIGSRVYLYCSIDERFHTGRIIHRRLHPTLQYYEHLLHFKR
jgi:hypothetical protein